MQRTERFNRADRVITLGFWMNAILMVMKITAGYLGNSEAVFADGVESACDFIAIVSTIIALRIGRRPCDESHPYGHGRAESISAILVSLVIFASGAGIFYNAAKTIAGGLYPEPHLMAVGAAFSTILIKEWLCRYSLRVGGHLGSPAVMAIAKDHRKDAVTSVATFIGVSGAFLGLKVLDPVAAGLTSFFIFHIGYQTFKGAANDLMDCQAPQELLQAITRIAEEVAGVEHVHEIKGRRSGQYVIIDLKLEMDPEMTVKQSHAIATQVKKLIFDRFSHVGDVMIHINPHEEEHEDLIRL